MHMTEQNAPVHNEAQHRFEVVTDAGIARLDYRLSEGTITLVHTEVPAELRGGGYGAALAKTALEFARAQDLNVNPVCPFVKTYIERHPAYKDLIGH